MKAWFAALLLAFALSGCAVTDGLFKPLHQEQTEAQAAAETPQQRAFRIAHAVIDEANVLLLAFDTVIGDNIDNRIWTKAQAQKYQDQAVAAGDNLERARELLRLGDPASAQAQAEAIKTIIIQLQREIAAAARQTQIEIPPIFT